MRSSDGGGGWSLTDECHSDRGATALQSLVVLVVVGVLLLMGPPIWRRFVERSRTSSCQSNQRSIVEAIGTARADGNVPKSVGYFDSVLEPGHDWGKLLIPGYLSKAPICPVSGQPYYMSPLGFVWSDRGAGQYTFVNQGLSGDHRLSISREP